MRIAITAMGQDLDAQVDPRFGRAKYFVIADKDGKLLETVDNSANINAMQGAGIQAAKVLADKSVDVLLTGHCGPNAFRTLQAAGIKVGVDQSGSVRQAIERFQNDQVSYADQPTVEAHW
jgi:predicted Fe-Mo cluster-binding NifX family protein